MPRKTKVAHLITRLDFGGAQQNTLHTVSHLDPDRYEVLLIAGEGGLLDDEARQLSSARARPFALRFVPSLVREVDPLRDAAALLQLRQILADTRPDVVHTHSSKAGILGRLAARLAGHPALLHTYHGFGFHPLQAPAVRAAYVALERLCAGLSDCSVFVSEANREEAARLGIVSPRTELIRSGVRLADYPALLADKGAKKASLGCRMHKPLVVSVGNLKPQKNPEAFVGVVERCAKEVPEANWLFVGDGPLRGRIEGRLVARGLSSKVFFPGWRKDTAEILAAADVFVLTSLWEGLPRALVEAMKSGLPSVCFATDGVRDLVRDGENGFLVSAGDEAAMAAKVVRLLKDAALAKAIGAEASKSVGREFDIDEMVRRQEKLYNTLVDARRSLPRRI
ncbi:MAG: glycosyltransferase family 4 protein [Elusimicrobia bacterium]|nr:glycosyltransferase family 4 protein [Elusimicrobiota bacterium]